MDNDREIVPKKETTDIVERSKMVFLREIVNEFSRRRQQYDLENEFAKTRKNRSIAIPLIIIGLIVVFGVLVTGVTRFIQTSSLAIRVDIDDFADVNLRDILDEAQRLQNQLDAAERELGQLQEEQQTRTGQIERALERELNLLQESGLSAAQQSSRAQTLRTEANQQIAQVNAELEPQIEELEARIAELQRDIAQYDSRQLEQAREQEEILNNQQRLFELEMAEMRDQYERQIDRLNREYEQEINELERFQEEFARNVRARHAEELARLREQHRRELEELTLRFNPVMDGEAVASLLHASAPTGAIGFGGPGAYRSVLREEAALDPAEYRALQRQYAEFFSVLERLQEIPYENSVPDALEQLDMRARGLVRRYDRVWRVLGDAVEGRDEVIESRDATIDRLQTTITRYRYSLDELSRFQGDTGYVIDPRDENAIVVYVTPILSVVPGTLGYVFRRDDEFVGTIRFVGGPDTVTARVEDTVDDMRIRAFDKVLIEVQEDD